MQTLHYPPGACALAAPLNMARQYSALSTILWLGAKLELPSVASTFRKIPPG